MRKTLKQKFDEANKQGINVPSELISNDDIVGVYGFFAIKENEEYCFYIGKAINICNLLEYLTQRDIQTKNSGVNVRYRGKHRFFKGFNEFIKEKTRRCDNDFEKIERHVFF